MANPEIYWQAHLGDAEELARVALWLQGLGVSEAAVERSFSYQKYVQSPHRAKLQLPIVQAQLFVRYNFVAFGDPKYFAIERCLTIFSPPLFSYLLLLVSGRRRSSCTAGCQQAVKVIMRRWRSLSTVTTSKAEPEHMSNGALASSIFHI